VKAGSEWIKIEGCTYDKTAFEGSDIPAFATRTSFHRELYQFLKEWFLPSPTLEVQTSGSTGTPKKMKVRKEQMWQSARITCGYLGLQADDKALLCLPLGYIAGKMMVVRALYARLDLYPVEPTGHPLAHTNIPFVFAAMIPLQIYNSLSQEEEKQRLSNILHLLIGGSGIDPEMEKKLSDFPNKIYSTYGMTETLSHIALRRINGNEASLYYTPLASVQVSLSDENTLVVEAPLICDKKLMTNDIAELHTDGSFRILGRKDNRINSGGIKMQIEAIEENLRPHLNGNFAITAIPDPKLGEAIVLLVETDDPERIRTKITQWLPRYQQPRHILRIHQLPLTKTGKPDRAAIRKWVEQACPANPEQ
jgi:O-succinylbenzoic acid--CoA ligase